VIDCFLTRLLVWHLVSLLVCPLASLLIRNKGLLEIATDT
jgi:hypothetical protein